MSIQLSTAVRNGRLDAVETAIGTSAVLKIFTGSPPASCAAANTGTELVSMTLPSDYMAAASSGTKTKSGTWEQLSATGTGDAGHFRIYASDGTTCHMQGTVGTSGADMTINQLAITTGDTVTVTSFSLTDANS